MSTRPGEAKVLGYSWAPPRHRWADLLNSDAHDHLGSGRREDRLEVDAWLGEFLGLCGWGGARLPDSGGRSRLRRLRGVMARIVASVVAGREPERRDLDAFNRWLRYPTASHRLELDRGSFSLREEPAGGNLDRVVGLLARGFAEILAVGETDRIKLCANPDCHWVIYDESRNRTRRWCEASACGSLTKVRRFRARRARGR